VLESYADRKARRELSALLERAPQVIHRFEDGHWITAGPESVVVGDRLLVKSGEVIPVDAVLLSPIAVLDESALTGEPLPVDRHQHQRVASGALNAGSAFEMQAIATVGESTYAGIVRMVEKAQAAKAPLVRLADRYAIWFLPVTLLIALVAGVWSRDPSRVVAVFVVATPCPLILAAPIAIISGVSRAASRGVLVKGGGALETLARGEVLILDKTGTVTSGVPTLDEVIVWGTQEADELLRLAASLDVVSPHSLAASIVNAARDRAVALSFPSDAVERLGDGIEGTVDGHHVRLGRASYVLGGAPAPPKVDDLRARSRADGSSLVFVAVDGVLAGALRLLDPVRPEALATVTAMRQLGFSPIVMATGDDRVLADRVAESLGMDQVLASMTPEAKLLAVTDLADQGVTVMVGDGINDAPALAAAQVGVAMGARGATATSEAADIVIMPDQLDRLAEAVVIARRSRNIAVQSIVAGMALSIAAMIFAAFGYLSPVAGALFQEAVDVGVILNALRARGVGKETRS
ncbi:MAG: heavy metal translocating P-type ATPase, partial [Thermoanaerobaculia bacterium]|nr:heavy metal translocating P-type ATPase [Thermoanaerobaculia bacterium]